MSVAPVTREIKGEGCFARFIPRISASAGSASRTEDQRRAREICIAWSRQLPTWRWARFDNDNWSSRVDRRLLEASRHWHPLDSPGLGFCGPTGTGKTSGIVASLHQFLGAFYRYAVTDFSAELPVLCWTKETRLIGAWRQHPLGAGEAPLVALAKAAQLLIIDELGLRGGEQLVFEILDERYSRGRKTCFTSGETPLGLLTRYGEACFRRLTEAGKMTNCFEVSA